MLNDSLKSFSDGVRHDWNSISGDVAGAVRRRLEQLLRASPAEDWLASLHRDAPANRELYRDREHGFVLLAHTEARGLYRPPHDHGRSWVVYGVQQGVSEMTTYARVHERDGAVRLVKQNSTLVRPGEVQVYLPGDVHDTRCVEGPAILYRFTERDLRKEQDEHHKITRFVERDGIWWAP